MLLYIHKSLSVFLIEQHKDSLCIVARRGRA
uniref:Uncharacterized protein n=1 Tax=Arundo donax TaxID=35708 RepID=A0A0A9AI21_ARUDO